MADIAKRPLTMDEATRPGATAPDAGDQAWHDEETRKAIKEADAGDSAAAEQVKATVRKYVPHG